MRILAPLIAGTVLSAAATAVLARENPIPVQLPPFSFSLRYYLALMNAPLDNGLELFGLIALIMGFCFAFANRSRR